MDPVVASCRCTSAILSTSNPVSSMSRWQECTDGHDRIHGDRCATYLEGALARTALSHYIFPDPDRTAARRHIRAAAGLPAG